MQEFLFPGSNISIPTSKVSFSGHETFPFRYTWLKKAFDAVKKDKNIFNREEALVDLGVGKNMVASIRHWVLVAGILAESRLDKNTKFLVASEFGEKIFSDQGWDPYLEDSATLWLLHWRICRYPNVATTWFYAFNKFSHIEFTKDQLAEELNALCERNGVKVSPAVIARDVDCFVRTYTPSRVAKQGLLEESLDCPLTELSLIQELGQKGLYVFSRGEQRDLPQEIFASCLAEYWDSQRQKSLTLSFEDVAYDAGSPGAIFKLDEDSLAYRLGGLEDLTKGQLRYEETAHLRQIYRDEGKRKSSTTLLKRYYESKAYSAGYAHAT